MPKHNFNDMAGKLQVYIVMCCITQVCAVYEVTIGGTRRIPHDRIDDTVNHLRIRCRGVGFKALRYKEFSRYTNLEYLEIVCCFLNKVIPFTAFQNVPLKSLHLHRCWLRTIPTAIFFVEDTLEILSIKSRGGVVSVGSDIFLKMRLSHLSLSKIIKVP